MEHNDQNTQPERFDPNRVSYLLDSAELAEQGGNSRLAIHLYCAAFEASQESNDGVDERTLSGLRQAWSLACKQGDRATAETIFNDLIPYNSEEQTQRALAELQEMAIDQLGLKKDDVEDIAVALADEMRDAGIDVHALAERFGGISMPPVGKIDLSSLASSFLGDMSQLDSSSEHDQDAASLPDAISGEIQLDALHQEPRYATMAGFERTKEEMRSFGIVDPTDTEMQGFLEQAESLHGVTGPVLTQNFLFHGASREDSAIFAQATANEIGWPVVTMIVDVNEVGDGTIKVVAPVRRSFFGPPRITDLPNPCTLIIQNIDILQDLFWGEDQAMSKGHGPYGRHAEDFPQASPGARHSGMSPGMMPGGHPSQQRSFQNEIIGYLGALFARGGVFVIATSAKSSAEYPLVLSEQLENLLGKPVEIAVDTPNLSERKRVLTLFSEDHPSFHDLDLESLARLSEGMSRFEIVASCRQAVEFAYSESLRNKRHQMVSLEDILSQFMLYLPQESESHRLVEDYLVAMFSAGLETDLLQADIYPNQISLDLDTQVDQPEASDSSEDDSGTDGGAESEASSQ